MNHLYQSAHHLLASSKVGNNAIAQWSYGAYVLVRFLIHQLRTFANGNHFVRSAVERNDRRFVYHNLVIADNDGIGRSKVHRNLLHERKKSHVFFVFRLWTGSTSRRFPCQAAHNGWPCRAVCRLACCLSVMLLLLFLVFIACEPPCVPVRLCEDVCTSCLPLPNVLYPHVRHFALLA